MLSNRVQTDNGWRSRGISDPWAGGASNTPLHIPVQAARYLIFIQSQLGIGHIQPPTICERFHSERFRFS